MEKCEPADSIIRKLGGNCAVAEITGAAASSVRRWRYPKAKGGTGGQVPNWHIPALLKFAFEAGVDLQPGDFFPPIGKS